ncbi:TolC family protein [Chitinophaga sedimenti]|uniref:TolC family protein n=1 Tax=Chitinophaga sedimenti TaxID=2033606 RepID=UPI002002E2DA|nr:TolC family protein [Chitinophaga sedimenti]MCK7559040.1 TolC family protein [Chitinophaga sedimenti]
MKEQRQKRKQRWHIHKEAKSGGAVRRHLYQYKMKLIKISLSGLLLLCLSLGAHAQDILTLEQAIDPALKNNYDLRLARNDAEVSANDYAYANFAFLPTLNATAGKNWTTSSIKQELANGNKRDTSGIKNQQLQASINLQWVLFDGLKMFATRSRVENIKVLGELTVKNQIVNTMAAVINGYYNIAQQKQQLRALAEQMSISDERVKLSDAKFQTGLAPKTDWLQARVDYNAQKAAHLRQQTLIVQAKASLNQLMGVDPANIGYDVRDSIPVNFELNYGTLQQGIDTINTDLKVARQNITISELALRERKGELFPVIAFNSAYNFNRNRANAATNQFSTIFNQNGGLNYGFSATVPIFNGFNKQREIKNAKLDIAYQQLSLENRRSVVNLSLTNAFKDYEYFKQALELEEETLELSKENVMVALERFRQGVSTTLELKEAQQSLEDSYNRLIQARYNTKLAETELLRLRGDLLR